MTEQSTAGTWPATAAGLGAAYLAAGLAHSFRVRCFGAALGAADVMTAVPAKNEVARLGYRDTGPPGEGPEFVAACGRLARHLPRSPAALILTTWRHDPHGDHVSTARLVEGARGVEHPARLLRYPIWGRFRESGPEFGFTEALLIAGDTVAKARKRRALACHRTQMTALIAHAPTGFVMPEWMQDHFVDHPEIYLAA